jgi:hypothetical protein
MENALVSPDQIKETRILIQNFHKILNQQPKKESVATNTYAGNSKYLPISFLEMKLDELFFGLWQTGNVQEKVVANEILVSLELKYFHPSALVWITRVGVGAAMIQQNKNSDITDLSAKIKNTLVKDYPHAKAQAFRNACLSIGKSFGRDLNREYEDTYNPIIKDDVDTSMKELQDKIIDGLDIYQGEDKEELQKMCADKVEAKEFNLKFAQSIAEKIGLKL